MTIDQLSLIVGTYFCFTMAELNDLRSRKVAKWIWFMVAIFDIILFFSSI